MEILDLYFKLRRLNIKSSCARTRSSISFLFFSIFFFGGQRFNEKIVLVKVLGSIHEEHNNEIITRTNKKKLEEKSNKERMEKR